METNSTYYIDLITRYLNGEATPGDIRELENWVNVDSGNREIFSEYHQTWKVLGKAKSDLPGEIDQAWLQIHSRIHGIDLKEQKTRPILQVKKSSILKAQSSLFISWSLRIAAVLLVAVIPAYFLYRYMAAPSETQLAAGNSVAEYTLPDGTVVTLNAGATLAYPSRFEGSSRNVKLQGEAWFEVARDQAKPFIIAAANVRIRVVGTSFFVNTRSWNNASEIILQTGKVKVYYADKPEKMAFLLPGDRAELPSGSYDISKTSNQDQNFLAWKTRHLVFCNTPLNEVAALLTRVYHTSIRISGDRLSECRITTTFDKQSLESVVNVLKATLDLQVRNTGAGIEISGRGCN
ncbi:MAG: FecR domain-containing protein [Bacteroidota bacterium]